MQQMQHTYENLCEQSHFPLCVIWPQEMYTCLGWINFLSNQGGSYQDWQSRHQGALFPPFRTPVCCRHMHWQRGWEGLRSSRTSGCGEVSPSSRVQLQLQMWVSTTSRDASLRRNCANWLPEPSPLVPTCWWGSLIPAKLRFCRTSGEIL